MTDEAEWSELINLGKCLLLSIYTDNQRGKNPKETGLPDLHTKIRYLIQWMGLEGYSKFSELNSSAARDFIKYLVKDKMFTDEDDSDSISAETVRAYLDVFCRIYEQTVLFKDYPAFIMLNHPFNGNSALAMADTIAERAKGWIRPVPDDVWLPTVSAAIKWLDAPARDVARLCRIISSFGKKISRESNLYSYHYNKVINGFRFDDDGALDQPWQSGLAPTGSAGNAGQRARGPMGKVRDLIHDVRDACTIVIQAMIGIRVSELAGLQAEPADAQTGFPACVQIRPSRTGLNEIFYVYGRLYKQRDQWQEVEWVAGSRPTGTKYLPPPIAAILALNDLFKPWRMLGSSNDLIVSLGPSSGLPSTSKSIRPILSDTLREGQKSFVNSYVKLPAGFEKYNLTTHQWRKSFALYLVRSDERLLAAVSDHFKHMSIAMTEEGYLGNDPELMGMMYDMATQDAARVIYEVINDRKIFSGKMADVIEESAESIMSLCKTGNSDDEKIAQLAEVLKTDEVRVWPSP